MSQRRAYNLPPVSPEQEDYKRPKGPVSFSAFYEREPALFYVAEDILIRIGCNVFPPSSWDIMVER